MSKLFDSILRDYDKQQEADALFTAALAALEAYDWNTAQNASKAVLDTSQSVEQRLAATFIFIQCVERDQMATSAWVNIAYQYEK